MINIKKGDRGASVRVVQRLLHIYVDGSFGPLTDEAVREFQRRSGLQVDGIVGPKTWIRLTGMILPVSSRTIDKIIIHCTATPEGRDYTVADITYWHKQRGFSDIGYHYVIYRDGTIHEGRNVNIAGAHCTGYNTHSIGVCYVGGLAADGVTPKDTRTQAQREALETLLVTLKGNYPRATIHGHREFAPKACPCFDARKEYQNL